MISLKRGRRAVLCPHCGQRVARLKRCEACGMRLRHFRRSRIIRFTVFVAVMAGLFFFQIVHSSKKPTDIRIREISPLLNFSTVRVEGVLERGAKKMKSGAVLYLINDGTGTLAAFDSTLQAGELPRDGCRVAAVGSLSVGIGNDRRLNIHTIDLMESGSDESMKGLCGHASSCVGQRIAVTGTVFRAWVPEKGSRAPYKLVLKDNSGELDVVHWLSGVPEIRAGDTVEVSGVVNRYQGNLQVKVFAPGDIRLHSAE